MDDLKITYRPMATTPARVEHFPKVTDWNFIDEMLVIILNSTTRVFIPVNAIQKVEIEIEIEVEGNVS